MYTKVQFIIVKLAIASFESLYNGIDLSQRPRLSQEISKMLRGAKRVHPSSLPELLQEERDLFSVENYYIERKRETKKEQKVSRGNAFVRDICCEATPLLV